MGKDKRGGGRGGGRGSGRKMFIANVEELQLRDREISEAQEARAKRRADEDDDEEGEENEEQDKTGETVFAFDRKSRAESQSENLKGSASEEPDATPKGLLTGVSRANPNRAIKPTEKMLKVKDLKNGDNDAPVDPAAGFSRKQREVIAAAKAKEDYMKRHLAGETEEARRQLEQLAIVRARREAAAKKRQEEGRAPGMTAAGVASDDDESDDDDEDDEDEEESSGEEEAVKGAKPAKPAKGSSKSPAAAEPLSASAALQAKKKAAALATAEEPATGDALPKLKAMDIKKMNGDALKEHLRARELSVQGQKKDLMKRLVDFEAARS